MKLEKKYSSRNIVATDGNINVWINENIIITPSSVCKGSLSADDLIVTDISGHKIRGTGLVSSELSMHFERVEHAAQIIFLAKQMCNPTMLTLNQVEALKK